MSEKYSEPERLLQKLYGEYATLKRIAARLGKKRREAEIERRIALWKEVTSLIEAQEPKNEKTYLDLHKTKFCAHLLITPDLIIADSEKAHEWICDGFRLPLPSFVDKVLKSVAKRIKVSLERNYPNYAAIQKWLLVPRANGGPSSDQKSLVMLLLKKAPIVPEDIAESMGKVWSQPADSVKSLARGVNIKLKSQKVGWRVVRNDCAYTIEWTA